MISYENRKQIPINAAIGIWFLFILRSYLKNYKLNISFLKTVFAAGMDFRNSLSILIDNIFSVVIVLFFLFSFFFLGYIFLKKIIKPDIELKPEGILFSLVSGIGIFSYMSFFVALTGLGYSLIYAGMVFLSAVAGIIIFVKNVNFAEWEYKPERISIISLIPVFIVLAFSFIMCLTPEMFYDSLNYHLGVPNYYLINHRLMSMPYKPHANFPLLMSMVYLPAIAIKGIAVTKLINYSCLVLTLMGIISFSGNILKNYFAGTIGALIFLTIPAVLVKSWVSSTETGLVMFAFFGLYSLIRFLNNGDDRWLVISGILAGFMLGVKYTAVFFYSGLIFTIIFSKYRKKTVKWVFISFIVFSPWIIRNIIETKNPVYPMLTKVFKSPYPYIVKKGDFPDSAPKLKRIMKAPGIFWELSLSNAGKKSANFIAYYVGGAVFITFLPFIIFLFRDKKIINILPLGIFFFISSVFWLLFSDRLYFFIPALPVLSIIWGLVIVSYSQKNKLFSKVSIFFLVIISFWNFLFVFQKAAKSYQIFSIMAGKLSKESLISKLPYYATYKYANQNLSTSAKILLFGGAQSFYLKRNFIVASVSGLNPTIEFLKKSKNETDFINILRKEKITHLLVNAPEALRTSGYNTLYFSQKDLAILEKFWKKHIRLIFQSKGVYLYEIIEAKTAAAPIYKNTIKTIYLMHKRKNIH